MEILPSPEFMQNICLQTENFKSHFWIYVIFKILLIEKEYLKYIFIKLHALFHLFIPQTWARSSWRGSQCDFWLNFQIITKNMLPRTISIIFTSFGTFYWTNCPFLKMKSYNNDKLTDYKAVTWSWMPVSIIKHVAARQAVI